MIYKCKTEERSLKDSSVYQNPIDLFKILKNGNKNPKEVVKNQINFKPDLGEIRKRNPKWRLVDQISVIKNVEKFFDLREKIIDFFRDYYFLLSEAKQKCEKCLKILTARQMLQRLPIALKQVKAGDTSKTLLSKIRQIMHFLYRAKVITKKVYNNIMNSIKLWSRMDTYIYEF